jgi:hypothetical protein
MWAHIAVGELVAMNLSLFAASVGLRPLIFAVSVGSKVTLFASPRLTVCEPLQLVLSTFKNMRKPRGEDGLEMV